MAKKEFIRRLLEIAGYVDIEKIECKGVRWEVYAKHKDHFNCGSISVATSEGYNDLLAEIMKEIYVTPEIEFSPLNVRE